MQCTFANYWADEDLKMADEDIVREVSTLGKVVVTAIRGNFTRGSAASWQGYNAPDTEVTSKEVVENNRVSHVK